MCTINSFKNVQLVTSQRNRNGMPTRSSAENTPERTRNRNGMLIPNVAEKTSTGTMQQPFLGLKQKASSVIVPPSVASAARSPQTFSESREMGRLLASRQIGVAVTIGVIALGMFAAVLAPAMPLLVAVFIAFTALSVLGCVAVSLKDGIEKLIEIRQRVKLQTPLAAAAANIDETNPLR